MITATLLALTTQYAMHSYPTERFQHIRSFKLEENVLTDQYGNKYDVSTVDCERKDLTEFTAVIETRLTDYGTHYEPEYKILDLNNILCKLG